MTASAPFPLPPTLEDAIIMAKKQTAESAPAKSDAPAAAEEKKSEEKKTRAPKAKTSPEAPSAAPAPAAPPAASPASAGVDVASRRKRPSGAPARGKKLRNHLKNVQQRIGKEGQIPLQKAIGLLKQIKRAKFDETVEIHMSLGVDTTQSDQMIRGSVPLPHGIGKTVRVVVFCQADNVAKAKEAGADAAGSDDLIEKIQKENWLDFDVALATQDLMGKVSRLGKVLGPRGLMPTPKAGTVVTGDVAAAVRDFKAGKVEYRTDKGGNVHAGVGKISFEDAKLSDNIMAFVDAIRAAKPSGVKGNYVKSVTLSSTMGPGIPVSV